MLSLKDIHIGKHPASVNVYCKDIRTITNHALNIGVLYRENAANTIYHYNVFTLYKSSW